MDDIDRLFQCFKCGISPPASALRERKRSKKMLNPENTSPGTCTKLQPSSLSGKGQGNRIDGGVSLDSVSGSKNVKKIVGRQFSPVVFYGSPNGVSLKRPLSLYKALA